MPLPDRFAFWRTVLATRGAVTPRILPDVLAFTVFATGVTLCARHFRGPGLAVGPVELAGGALVLLLVLRANAGYDRWWEGRKIWGGIVNQSRNLAVVAVCYGPEDSAWRGDVLRLVASYPYACMHSLRGERELPSVRRLLGDALGRAVERAGHMPAFISVRIGQLLRDAYERRGMERLAFFQGERQRSQLIDDIGACERILKTPLAFVWVIKIRRFIAVYLLVLPFALVPKVGWAAPALVALVSYALLGVDRIAVELENPFNTQNLSHLPLDEIAATIERNVLSLDGELRDACNDDADRGGAQGEP